MVSGAQSDGSWVTRPFSEPPHDGNNLADLHRAQGNYADAAPLFQRSLEIQEMALGPDHPDVVANLNNLAVLARRRPLLVRPVLKNRLPGATGHQNGH